MKKAIFIFSLLISFCVTAQTRTNSGSLNTEDNVSVKYSKLQIETFIRDVFMEHANELVFNNPDSKRLSMITAFLNHRFNIIHVPELAGKGFDLLSTVELSNKYNPNLQRNFSVVNPLSFNPLKYNLPMFPKTKLIYRIDTTDYIITILPSN